MRTWRCSGRYDTTSKSNVRRGGAYPLIDSTLSKIFMPTNGLAVTLSTLQQRRDLAQRAVNALLEATQTTANYKPRVVGVLTSEFELSEKDAE